MDNGGKPPVVSVVVPFAGRIDWLEEAVDSVRKQTFDSWELIVVSDEPAELTAHLAQLDARVRIFPGTGKGPGANRNVGIQVARGEYVAFLDADDTFYPEKLERQLRTMREKRARFSHTSYERVGPDHVFLDIVHSGRFTGSVYPSILLRCPIATPTVMATRELLIENPFDEELRVSEDTLMWIALARKTKLVGIDNSLSSVRVHGRNAAICGDSQVAAWQNILRLALPKDDALPHETRLHVESVIHRTLAMLERRRGRKSAALRSCARASRIRGRLMLGRIAKRVGSPIISLRRSIGRARKGTHARDIEWISREDALSTVTLRNYLVPAQTILDVGVGIRPQTLLEVHTHICVEPFEPYLERLREDYGDDPKLVLLNATWDQVMPLLPDRSVDSVVALDVIEHLKRREGRRLLVEAVRVARRQVVIFTPLGFLPQSYSKDEFDAWGMGGTRWQIHRSGWWPEDFPTDWHVVACADFHVVDRPNTSDAAPFGALWAIYTHRSDE